MGGPSKLFIPKTEVAERKRRPPWPVKKKRDQVIAVLRAHYAVNEKMEGAVEELADQILKTLGIR